jgi:hypothetical protein
MMPPLECSNAATAWPRAGVWSRLRELGIIRAPDLVHVHRIAQEQRVPPVEVALALGLLKEEQLRRVKVPGTRSSDP